MALIQSDYQDSAKRTAELQKDVVMQLDHVHKTYYMGDLPVRALRGI